MHLSAVYSFCGFPEAELDEVEARIWSVAVDLDLRGIFILAPEGFNTTFAGNLDAVSTFKLFLLELTGKAKLDFKDSRTTGRPFRRFKIKQREEIVTTATPGIDPREENTQHLSPKEWHNLLQSDEDLYLVDTRNWYETKLGTFKNAVDPKINAFTDFPEFIEKQNLPKDKKVLMFCTGGIRCEKGAVELQRQGFRNVYQLKGGILNYLKEFPNEEFEGECFVFDHRVAVDQNLGPSKRFVLCTHCGQPGEIHVTCARCETEAVICEVCQDHDIRQKTCSKNCAYQWEQHPGDKGPPQPFQFDRTPI